MGYYIYTQYDETSWDIRGIQFVIQYEIWWYIYIYIYIYTLYGTVVNGGSCDISYGSSPITYYYIV